MSAKQSSHAGNHLSEVGILHPSTVSHLSAIYPEELLEPNRGINIRDFWNVIKRNKKLLGMITGAAFLLALLISLLMSPVYRASTTIQIERQATKMADVILEPTARRSERDFWETQIQLLQSRSLAQKVLDNLNIRERFSHSSGLLSSLRSAPPTPEEIFLKGLQVEPLSNSQLIMIHYESGDPELSAAIVNNIAETYIETNLERQYETAEYTQKFLQKQKEDVKNRLTDTENSLDQFARKNNIVELDNNQTTQTHILKKLAEELVSAEKLRIDLENEYKQLELAANSPDPSMFLNTQHMQSLKKDLRALETKYDNMVNKYGAKSRSARNAKSEVEQARGKIRSEADLYKESLNAQLQSAKESEQALNARLGSLQEESLNIQGKVHTYNNLKREVAANQEIYQNLQERIKEAGLAGGIDSNNITIIDKALVPQNKYKPKVKMNLLFGTLMGLLLGIAAIFLREFMDDSIKDADELEYFSGLPMLGAIPDVKGRSSYDIAQQIIKEPKSPISEAIRSLRTALSFSTQDGAPRSLFFTSSEASEGKTSIALNLATAYALAGERVLIIDADLRSPSIHSLLKLDNRQGMSNYLSGNTDLSTLIQRTSVPGLFSLVSGPLPPDPVELLSGRRLKDLLAEVKESHDRVIIDGPPVLGLADALILANITDATLMTIHAEKTRKGTVQTSLKRLKQARAHVLGTLMNQANHLGSGYGYLNSEQYASKA